VLTTSYCKLCPRDGSLRATAHMVARPLELQSPLDLASRKDTGFDTPGSIEAPSSFGTFTSADFGIDRAEYDHLLITVPSGGTTSLGATGANRLTAAKVLTGSSGARHQLSTVRRT
jgi:hypothetical protein